MTYLIIDLETGIKEGYGRKGNPWLNNIVAIGMKHDSFNSVVAEYFEASYLNEILDGITILVGHNIKFDLLYLWKYPAFQDWLKNGGKIWDTQLAEYYLTNLQSKMAKLRTIAVEKYGCPERPKYMEEYWAEGIDTRNIPKSLVLEDVTNDVLDTEKIYSKQVLNAIDLNMFPLIEGHMEGLLATCEMEYNGMKIDKDILSQNRAFLQHELTEALAKLNEVVKLYWRL